MLGIGLGAAVHKVVPHPLHEAQMRQGALLVPVSQLGVCRDPTFAVRCCSTRNGFHHSLDREPDDGQCKE